MFKAIHINSKKQTIDYVMVDDFKSIQKLIDTGVLTSISWDDDHMLLIDEEGYYHQDRNGGFGFYFKGRKRPGIPVLGDGVIVARNGEGMRDNVSLSLDNVKECISLDAVRTK